MFHNKMKSINSSAVRRLGSRLNLVPMTNDISKNDMMYEMSIMKVMKITKLLVGSITYLPF